MQRKVPSAIANITLNRATFTDVLIDGLTFVNFFYGNNGAGKSSIAHAIAEDDGVVWADGKTVDDFDVLVYNQDFINDNFVNYGDLKGVFIFGEEDIEAKKKIAELTNQKKQKMDARQTALDEYKKKSDGLASALTQFQDTCFSKTASIRRRFGKCMDGKKQKKNFAGTEISGKKLGVIGLGAIGVLVANAAVHMGMDVYGYDPYISVNAAWNLSRSVKHISNVEDIYKNCDFITIHVPLLDSTKKMVNADAIAMMKPTAIVLNFARDLLVDEEAMVDALAKGKVKKYVSDFPNNTTVGAKGCIVTPHLGASTAESEDNCAVMAVKELRDYLENGNIVHSVNFPDCSMGACTASGRVGILHKNVKGMIGQITTALAEADINVSDLTNKGKGDYAYSLLDLDSAIDASTVEKLSAIDGVLRVRVIK
ncbi:MAG TPA: hypothetical protein DCX81_05410 [Eubacterium sp.]|nr:hypothetical protein [Eubacterium sp.]